MDSDAEVFTVERILSHKATNKQLLFLVKWFNYPIEESTWEPEENLFCHHLVAKYWENPRPRATLKRIIEEEMAKRAEMRERSTSIEGDSSDEVNSETEFSSEKRPVTASHREKPEEEFNWRAFFKLGFTVSALIVIGFILWSGNDQYYMAQFYSRRVQGDHPQHVEN